MRTERSIGDTLRLVAPFMYVLLIVFCGSVSVFMHTHIHDMRDWDRDQGTWESPESEVTDRYSTPWRAFVSTFTTMMGDMRDTDLFTLDAFSTHSLTWFDDAMEGSKVFIFVFFIMFVQFILLNISIGIMSLATDLIYQNDEGVRMVERANIICDIESTMARNKMRKPQFFPRTFLLHPRKEAAENAQEHDRAKQLKFMSEDIRDIAKKQADDNADMQAQLAQIKALLVSGANGQTAD